MWKLIKPILLLLFVFDCSYVAQEKRNKAVVVPTEIYLPTVVVQPDCPIRIEKAFVGKMLDGSERIFTIARNITSRPIVSFQIHVVGSNGSSDVSIFPYKKSQGTVAPGAIAPSVLNEDSLQFIPLTEDLKQKLRLDGKMRLIVFFIVSNVEFQDGTTYDAVPLLDSLEKHLNLFKDIYDKFRP